MLQPDDAYQDEELGEEKKHEMPASVAHGERRMLLGAGPVDVGETVSGASHILHVSVGDSSGVSAQVRIYTENGDDEHGDIHNRQCL